MSGSVVLLHLAGAVALMLFATRMVKTGVERAYGDVLRRRLRATMRNPIMAVLAGCGLSVALQSSTAVTLLVGSFAGVNLSVDHSTFTANRAVGQVGAAYVEGGAIWNTDNTNHTRDQGAGATAVVIGCTFVGNQAVGADGGSASGAAASADASLTQDAFNQTITQGANIQFNSITMNVAGNDFEDSHDLG